MLDDKRFIKFKCEKQNNNLKFKDEEIHILFFNEKNLLLSENLNIDEDLLKFFKRTVLLESSNIILIRSEKGNFLLVKRKTMEKDLSY